MPHRPWIRDIQHLAVILLGASSCTRSSQPNILILMADDYGPMDTAVTGSDYYETPNIDMIADRGVRFTDGYAACTVSSPTRASLMTGAYTTRHGITDWIGSPAGEQWREEGWCTQMLPPDYVRNLDVEKFLCLPQALRNAGYSTFMAGKWHLGSETTPEMAGFEINRGGYAAGQPRTYFSPYRNPKLEDGPDGEELSMRLARETNAFMEEHVRRYGKKKPFFAFLSFYAVHTPVETTEEYWRHFRDKAAGAPVTDREAFVTDRYFPVCQVQDNPVFAGLVKQMDDAVGAVMTRLKELKLDRNTVVIFMSDNGGLSSCGYYSTSNYPFRGGKTYQWEGGIRVPFFIYDPAAKKNGTLSGVPVNTIDIYPTLMDYAGVQCPEGQVDGVSIRPLLNGKSIPDRPLFWHYPHYGGAGGDPCSIIRHGRWKLIFYHEDSHVELYDLESDPRELDDVASAHEEQASALMRTLREWMEKTGAKMPQPDPEYSEEARQAFLSTTRVEMLREQTAKRARRLSPDFRPDDTWWGSQPVKD